MTTVAEARAGLLDSAFYMPGDHIEYMEASIVRSRLDAFEAAVRAEEREAAQKALLAIGDLAVKAAGEARATALTEADLVLSSYIDAVSDAEAKLATLREAAYDDGHHDGMEPHDDVGYCQHSGAKYVLAATPAER